MAQSSLGFSVPEEVMVPSRGVIVDFTKVFRYIQDREVLDVFSKQLGLVRFIEDLMFSYFNEDTDDFDDVLADYFDIDQLVKFENQGFYKYDLHQELLQFQTFRDRLFFSRLDPNIQEEFLEYGFYIESWISPQSAIISSNKREKVPYYSRYAKFHRRSKSKMGNYH